jgi:hypothetical protein
VVSIAEDDDFGDSISDICENRHCSTKVTDGSEPRQASPACDSSVVTQRSTPQRSVAQWQSGVYTEEEKEWVADFDLPSVIYHTSKSRRLPPTDAPPVNVSVVVFPKSKQKRSTPPQDYPTIIYENTKTKRRYGYV